MVGDAWLRGNVPNAYAKQTLQTTQKELQNEIDTLTKVAPAQNRIAVLDRVQQPKQTVAQMATDVDQKDRTALTQEIH